MGEPCERGSIASSWLRGFIRCCFDYLGGLFGDPGGAHCGVELAELCPQDVFKWLVGIAREFVLFGIEFNP